ncbi:MAG: ORC1-type DNA replication protein [Candidatus Nezhaarchaeota archaeon]|nr:ORC1-type DNA replication protein [Candidatus Nezhaarchaeota archaeon]MCX8141637.1 ORC1-type DNA replication protein [Candidatus Nezhaarchaeota archaeon]MDW8049904.1 ORC1-type DNA replication protein [Nitrososphaerota archaeon]
MSIDEIIRKVLAARIFKDREKLRPDYVPETLPHREDEINKLAKILAPAVKGTRPSNIFIYGLPGTGKTAVTKYVLRRIEGYSGSYAGNVKLKVAYINCRNENTNYRVLFNLCNYLDEKVPFTGLSTAELFRRFIRALDRDKILLFVVLDEVDFLVKASGDDVLYKLTRINPDLHIARVSIIGITNDLNFIEYLDPRVKSALSEEELIFRPYTTEELADILSERAKLAFNDGILDEAVIPLCATLAAREHGDARRALDLLRVAGEIAEREGAPKVLEEHVRKAYKEIEKDRVVEVMRSMPLHSKLVVMAVYLIKRKEREATTGEIYETYRGLCRKLMIDELTQRRVSDIINELDMLGIVNARVTSKGRYGRTKLVRLAISERALIEGLKTDPRLTHLLINKFEEL